MSKRIEFEGKQFDVPQDATMDEIDAYIRTQNATDKIKQGLATQQQYSDTTPSAMARFGGGVADVLQPLTIPNLLGMARHPIDTITNAVQAQKDMLAKANAANTQGNTMGNVGYSLAANLPLIGPAAARAGETIGSGDIAGGAGQAAALLAPSGISVAAEMAPAAARALKLSSIRDYASALAPKEKFVTNAAGELVPGATKPTGQAIRAAQAAPELSAQQHVFPSADAMMQSAKSLGDMYGAQRQGIRAQLEAAGQTISAQNVLTDLDKIQSKAISAKSGANLNPGFVKAMDSVKELVSNAGPDIPIEDADRLKQTMQDVAKSSYESAESTFLKAANKAGAASLSEKLHAPNPDLAAVDKSFTLWRNVQMAAAKAAKQNPGINWGFGTASGMAEFGFSHNPIQAAATGVITSMLPKLLQSTAWKTLSGATKSQVAELLMQPDLRPAALLIGRMTAAAGSAATLPQMGTEGMNMMQQAPTLMVKNATAGAPQ